jgi:L-rhamnose mutarotase
MNITIISLSTKEIKVLEALELNNVMSYSKFMEGTNKPFKKLVTAYVINKLMTDQAYVFRKYTYLKNISSELMNKLSLLEDYRNKNYRDGSTEIYTAMLELAQENNLFDYSIYHEYIRMKETLEKLYFLNSILGSLNFYSYNSSMSPGVERAMVDLMKYHKFKVNLDHYTRLEEDKLEEQFC